MFVGFEAEMNSWCDPGQDGDSQWTSSRGVCRDGHGLSANGLIPLLSGPSWSTPARPSGEISSLIFFSPFFVFVFVIVKYTSHTPS